MTYAEFRHGALYVAEAAKDKDTVSRELRQIDDRLFLERQITYTGESVWCVVCSVGGDIPPITILEHRAPDGTPMELTSSVVDRVSRMERDGQRLAAKVVKQNRDRIEAARQEARRHWVDMAEDMTPSIEGKRSVLLPRSQKLRQSRDKRRAQGENV